MSSIIFAWIASIIYGFYSISAKFIGKYQLSNSYQFSFFITFFSGVLMSFIAYLYGAGIPTNWTYIILSSAFMAIGSAFYLATLKVLDVSVISPLYNLRVAITVLLGALFLGESLTSNSLILILIILIAGFFATMDEKFSIKSFFTPKVGLGLGFMFVLSIQSLLINRAIDQNSYWTAMLWMSIFSIFFSFSILYSRFKHDLKTTSLKNYYGVAFLAVIGAVGDLTAYKAFEANVGISSVIISLPISMIMIFVLSFWKPNLLEKHTLRVYLVRFLAAFIMVWCALQLK